VKDKEISCVQCEKPFVFTVGEQCRFVRLGFDTPKRCPDCRKRKSRMIEVNEGRKDRNNRKRAFSPLSESHP
jgi:hypothetical protein